MGFPESTILMLVFLLRQACARRGTLSHASAHNICNRAISRQFCYTWHMAYREKLSLSAFCSDARSLSLMSSGERLLPVLCLFLPAEPRRWPAMSQSCLRTVFPFNDVLNTTSESRSVRRRAPKTLWVDEHQLPNPRKLFRRRGPER